MSDNVIAFPRATEFRALQSFAELGGEEDPALEGRAAELKACAQETLSRFGVEATVEMLAWAAARLERHGFRTFR